MCKSAFPPHPASIKCDNAPRVPNQRDKGRLGVSLTITTSRKKNTGVYPGPGLGLDRQKLEENDLTEQGQDNGAHFNEGRGGGACAEKATMGLAFEMAGVVLTSACGSSIFSEPLIRKRCKKHLVKLNRKPTVIIIPVTVTRDSSEQQVKGAFRSVARKVHPDKPGGSQEESNISLLNYLTDCTVFEGIQVD